MNQIEVLGGLLIVVAALAVVALPYPVLLIVSGLALGALQEKIRRMRLVSPAR